MARDPLPAWAEDPRSTDALVEAYLAAPDTDDGRDALVVLQYRGGEAEFAHAARLARSAVEAERVAATTILGNLGCDQPTFVEESVSILVSLLADPAEEVVGAAAAALGNRRHPAAIGPLVALARHGSADVRHGVVLGLTGHDDPRAVATLVELTRDADRDVRDWATFGVGQFTTADTPELREALFERTGDEDLAVRGEALVGLAMRRDPRALPLVRAALEGEFHGDRALEAATCLAEPSLHPVLEALLSRFDFEGRQYYRISFEEALDACRPR